MRKKDIFIDSLNGGNGDIWMRLVGIYAASEITTGHSFNVLIPPFLRPIAKIVFGDRIGIINEIPKNKGYMYTTLGIRHLIKRIATGQKFIVPYHRAVIKDKKKRSSTDQLNIWVFNFFNLLGFVNLPAWNIINYYQGFLDIAGLPPFKKLDYKRFVAQLESDYDQLFQKMQKELPISPEFALPEDICNNVVVFPTGTSRQFIPSWWAKKYLPNAYYAFFYKDKDADHFIDCGLKVIWYFSEPGDMIKLSQNAAWTLSTDSFSSHLLQYSSANCTITITEVLRSRVISPAFKGHVVDAIAPCHPCLHLDRKNHPLCSAGFSECINWKDETYSQNILKTVVA